MMIRMHNPKEWGIRVRVFIIDKEKMCEYASEDCKYLTGQPVKDVIEWGLRNAGMMVLMQRGEL